MHDQSPDRSTATLQDNAIALGDAISQPANRRQSVGLVELQRHPGLEYGFAHIREGITDGEDMLQQPASAEDLLQYFLATESSRQEMETYSRYLDTVMRQNSQARIEAEKSARLKSDFMATMSTEMRTPLIGIIGMADVLLSRPLGESEHEYVATIRRTGQALRAIMDDVLDLSRMDAGRLRLARVNFDLAQPVSDALRLVQPTASLKGLAIQVSHDARLPKLVRGDASRIQQVLQNLLSNAVKFTRAGTIEVCTRLQSVDQDECELLFSVKDEGIGIKDEQKAKLFQAFGQPQDLTTRRYMGSGIGLAICKRLAEMMGGQMGVTSRYGEGSLFWFSVKVQVIQSTGDAPAAVLEAPAMGTNELKPKRILLVEDNKADQHNSLSKLENLGYNVDVVQNGTEALLALDGANYDLVLMDCLTPEMSGFEATRRLRAQEDATPQMPIIAMISDGFEADRVDCLSAGMNDFLGKPLNDADLAAKLTFWLSPDRLVKF